MNKYFGNIYISEMDARSINWILQQSRYGHVSGGQLIRFYSTGFPHPTKRIEADIKVISGEPPYIDAVLFDNGHEVVAHDPEVDHIEGQYRFWYNDELFVVDVFVN